MDADNLTFNRDKKKSAEVWKKNHYTDTIEKQKHGTGQLRHNCAKDFTKLTHSQKETLIQELKDYEQLEDMYVKDLSEGQFVLIYHEESESQHWYPALATHYDNLLPDVSVLIEPIVEDFTGEVEPYSLVYKNKAQWDTGKMSPVRYDCAFNMEQYINNGKTIGELLDNGEDSNIYSRFKFEKCCVTVFPDSILANIFKKYKLLLRL